MPPTMQSIRRGAALGVFAAVLLTIGTPRNAVAHTEITEDEARRPERIHPPEAPQNLRVEGAAGRPDLAIRVSWTPGHGHERFGYYWITVATIPLPSHRADAHELNCISDDRDRSIPDCIRYNVRSGRASYSETVSGLMPETTYYVHVAETFETGSRVSYGSIAMITTAAAPGTPDPETPTTSDPETPEPEAPTCTYKHRIIGVPGTTGAGFTSQILISSEDATATVELSAYQHDNGHAIDVLDSEGAAVGASTSLAPSNSVKVFRLEGARGWHTVIVKHATKAAMDAATVAMRLREPDTGVTVEHVPGIEHCTPAATTTE